MCVCVCVCVCVCHCIQLHYPIYAHALFEVSWVYIHTVRMYTYMYVFGDWNVMS